MNLEKYNAFIEEQKNYFNQNLQANFKWSWNDASWYGGTIGSGWLLTRSGKSYFTFGTIKKLKGIENCIIEPIFQDSWLSSCCNAQRTITDSISNLVDSCTRINGFLDTPIPSDSLIRSLISLCILSKT